MREFERIDRILTLIKDIWTQQPDMRFNQLMDTLSSEFSKENENKYVEYSYSKFETPKGIIFHKDMSHIDLFYVEDDKFEGFLVNYLREMKLKS